MSNKGKDSPEVSAAVVNELEWMSPDFEKAVRALIAERIVVADKITKAKRRLELMSKAANREAMELRGEGTESQLREIRIEIPLLERRPDAIRSEIWTLVRDEHARRGKCCDELYAKVRREDLQPLEERTELLFV